MYVSTEFGIHRILAVLSWLLLTAYAQAIIPFRWSDVDAEDDPTTIMTLLLY